MEIENLKACEMLAETYRDTAEFLEDWASLEPTTPTEERFTQLNVEALIHLRELVRIFNSLSALGGAIVDDCIAGGAQMPLDDDDDDES